MIKFLKYKNKNFDIIDGITDKIVEKEYYFPKIGLYLDFIATIIIKHNITQFYNNVNYRDLYVTVENNLKKYYHQK